MQTAGVFSERAPGVYSEQASRENLLRQIREGSQKLFQEYSDPGELSWALTHNFVWPWEHHQRIERERRGRPPHHPSPLAVQIEPNVFTYRRILGYYQ